MIVEGPGAGESVMPTADSKPPQVETLSRVLIVDDEPAVIEFFRDTLSREVGCHVSVARTLEEARAIIASEPVDLLVADIHLPDGSGLGLLGEMRRVHPSAASLVITGKPTTDAAVTALRGGAVDFLAKPFKVNDLIDRVAGALNLQRLRARQDARLRKLKDAVKRLNVARKTVNKKVDLLCNDLIGAYGELSRQLETVRIQEGFTQFVDRAGSLEQLLCHSMDWLLRQVGYCNIGIWLTANDNDLQLGAFMKYTVAAEPELCEALQKNLLRITTRRGYVRLRGTDAKNLLTPGEIKHLVAQDVVAIHCTYLGETLGAILLFRDEKTPFSDEDVNALKMITPLFALSLAKAVRGIEVSEDPQGEPERESDDIIEDSAEERPKPKKKNKPRKDPADWWKTGETPPF